MVVLNNEHLHLIDDVRNAMLPTRITAGGGMKHVIICFRPSGSVV